MNLQKGEQKVLEGVVVSSGLPSGCCSQAGSARLPTLFLFLSFPPLSSPFLSPPPPSPGDIVGPFPGLRGAGGGPSWKPTCKGLLGRGLLSLRLPPARSRFLEAVTVGILFLVSASLQIKQTLCSLSLGSPAPSPHTWQDSRRAVGPQGAV